MIPLLLVPPLLALLALPPQTDLETGLTLLKQGRLQEAARHLEQAVRADPSSPVAWLGVARVRLRLDNPDGAVQAFQEAIRLQPDHRPYYLDLARFLLDRRTPEPAVLVLDSALRRWPKDPELLRLLALACYAQGDAAKALDHFLQAIDLDPDNESGYASLETLLPEAGGRLPAITQRLRRFAGRRPASPLGPYLLALVSPAEAGALLEKAIAAAPDFWPAWFELHKLRKAQGDWAEVRRLLEKTVELNPAHAPSHYALAEVYSRLGDRVRARAERELHHRLLSSKP